MAGRLERSPRVGGAREDGTGNLGERQVREGERKVSWRERLADPGVTRAGSWMVLSSEQDASRGRAAEGGVWLRSLPGGAVGCCMGWSWGIG